MEHDVVNIRKNLKEPQDKQKSYAGEKMTHKEFKAGEHFYLKIKPKRSSLRMRACEKLLT